MSKFDADKFRSSVLSIIQPLYRGTFSSATKLGATLKDLLPFGTGDRFQTGSPYGFISKPVSGTYAYFLNLLGKAQAPVIISHLDLDRPEPANAGESMMYSSGKYQFYVKNDKIFVGKDGVYEEVVAGETLRQLLISLINAINAHTHTTGAPGSPTGPPLNIATFTALKTNNLDNSKILIKDGGRF